MKCLGDKDVCIRRTHVLYANMYTIITLFKHVYYCLWSSKMYIRICRYMVEIKNALFTLGISKTNLTHMIATNAIIDRKK